MPGLLLDRGGPGLIYRNGILVEKEIHGSTSNRKRLDVREVKVC